MRKALTICMLVLFILTILTGVAESNPRHAGPAVAHIGITILFIITVLTHAWVNRKAFRRYFLGSGKEGNAPGA
jgi:hypothetical protein